MHRVELVKLPPICNMAIGNSFFQGKLDLLYRCGWWIKLVLNFWHTSVILRSIGRYLWPSVVHLWLFILKKLCLFECLYWYLSITPTIAFNDCFNLMALLGHIFHICLCLTYRCTLSELSLRLLLLHLITLILVLNIITYPSMWV